VSEQAVNERTVIAGVGFAVPDATRDNSDPIFDWIHAHVPAGQDPFRGYVTRRVLAPNQDLADVMVPAARAAMADANVNADDIDMLIGFGSLSLMAMPNPLALVHQKLGLLPHVAVVPVANDYANFPTSVALATALVETKRARNVLVVCGSNWTRHVDYHSSQCIAAGDGAGAVVVSARRDPQRFALVDTETITESALYGAMFMAGNELVAPPDQNGPVIPGYDDHQFTWPFFQITARGMSAFSAFAEPKPVEAVNRLLARNDVRAGEVTLIPHQASNVLLDYWQKQINPGCFLDTMTEYADVPHANIPITLAARYADIKTRSLVLLTLGVEFSTTAMLLSRESA
jgi:3-oxoacyl-[acyl-carrier-protein] synthase-3